MGSGWENPGPSRAVVIAGPEGQLLVYDGKPALGNLILSISSIAGVDKFGNVYAAGLNIYRTVAGDHPLNFWTRTGSGTATQLGQLATASGAMLWNSLPGFHSAITLNDNTQQIDLSAGGYVINSGIYTVTGGVSMAGPVELRTQAIKLGFNGTYGSRYKMHATWTASLASGVVGPVANSVIVHEESDYGVSDPYQTSPAQFTAAENGFYDFTLSMDPVGSSTGAWVFMRVNGTAKFQAEMTRSNSPVTLSVNSFYLAVNDVVTFHLLQTGGAASETGIITISRHP